MLRQKTPQVNTIFAVYDEENIAKGLIEAKDISHAHYLFDKYMKEWVSGTIRFVEVNLQETGTSLL